MGEGLKEDVDALLRACGADPAEANCALATDEGRAGVLLAVRMNTADAPGALIAAVFTELRDRFEAIGADAAELALCVPDAAETSGAEPGGGLRYPLVSLADFEARPVAPDLVAGVLPLDALAVLVAPPAAGKSAVALAVAGCVACGRPFLGRATRIGFAVYVLGEGQGRFSRRTRALRILRPELEPDLLNDRLRLIVQPVPLTEPDAVRDVLRSIETLPEAPKLIVVDTLSRCFGLQRDENRQMDMGAFVAGCDALKRATGACVLVLHHVGATGERARGSTVLGGAADVELSLSADGMHLTIADTKAKDSGGSGGLRCRLAVAETPEPDELGATGVAVVAEPSATGGAPAAFGDLPASHRWVMHTLRRAPFNGPEGAAEPELRDAPDVAGMKRPTEQAGRKALVGLIEAGLVAREGKRRAYRYRLTQAGRALLGAGPDDGGSEDSMWGDDD